MVVEEISLVIRFPLFTLLHKARKSGIGSEPKEPMTEKMAEELRAENIEAQK